MTHPLKRTALILAVSGAIAGLAAPALAGGFHPNYPIRLSPAQRQDAPSPAPQDASAVTAPYDESRSLLRLIAVGSEALPPAEARLQPAIQVDDWSNEPRLIRIASHKRAHHAAAPKAEAAEEAQTYTVKKGDTLDKIAGKLGTTVAELKKINHLKSSAIHPGQKLKGPGAAPAKAKAGSKKSAAPATYTVKKGDTLYSIAKKHGVTVEELKAANGLGRKGAIHAGQKLKLGAAAAEEEAETPALRHTRAEPEGAGHAVTTRAAEGRVVEVPGPARTYKVKKGDTLSKAADKLGVSVAELKKLNKIKGSTIRAGQVLKGPHGTAKAYVAAPGDTLGDVARRFSVTPEALRAANGLKRNATIRPGQKLRLPAGYRDRGPITTTTHEPGPEPTRPTYTPSEPGPALPSRPQPYTPGGSTPRPIPATPPAAPSAAPALSDAQISTLGRGRFVWPVRGDVLSSFGPKPGGNRNDGLNIRGVAGDPVRAASAGDVVYAGDQVPGFGNLVLIKHPDGWVTAYGHLSRVDVKMQQKVAQGQQIGLVGQTGGVSEPQLHFEVRYGPPGERARPIDPNLVLPH